MMDDSFKKQFINGTFYIAIAKYAGIVISIGITSVLSRLLVPSDFGIIAIATIFINFFALITTMGIAPAIVQNRNLNNEDIRSLYSLTFYLAFIFSFIFVLITPLIASFYDNEKLENICFVLAVNIFFSVITIVPNSLLLKAKKFKFIAVRTVLIQMLIGAISIIWAFNEGGVYTLLINPVIGSVLIYFVTLRAERIKFSMYVRRRSVEKIISFSIYQMLFNIINLLYRNVDKLLIGKCFNMVELGYYEKSYRLMMLPLENVSNVITPVLHPILSEYQNNVPFIYSKYKTLVSFLAWIGFPLSAFLYYSSSEIILILFGKQWEASIPVFRILSLSVGLQLIQSAIGSIYQVTNQVKKMFIVSLLSMFLILLAVGIGLYFRSLPYMAWCIVGAFLLTFVIYHFVLIKLVLKEKISSFIKILLLPLFYTILLIVLYQALFLSVVIENTFLSLSLKGGLFLLMILPLYWIIDFKSKIQINC